MMRFDFDIRKTIAAVAFLLDKQGGELDTLPGLKMLYLADKQALIKWGKPITGDVWVSMDLGPVLSETYNLFKGEGQQTHQTQWNEFFTDRVNHRIRRKREASVGPLSDRELELLEWARREVTKRHPWLVSNWMHRTCPEWRNPRGSSIVIEPETILKGAGMTDDEIREIEESNEVFRRTKAFVRPRR